MESFSTSTADSLAPADKVGAVVVAAGESSRMQGVDKIFAPLNGKPLLFYCLQILHNTPQVSAIALVLSRHNIQLGRDLVEKEGWRKVVDVCEGGQRRQDSVLSGVQSLTDCDWIVVQDGARPFIQESMVSDGMKASLQTGSAVAAVPAKDTIKVSDESRNVIETLPRKSLWLVQTPQIFNRELLLKAHAQVKDDVTDDASMLERIGVKTRIFTGSYENLKVTTPEDLFMAEAIMKRKVASTSEAR